MESTLKMLGDASSGNAEALESLSAAYGKISAKGKASMEELNIMIDCGVPILQALADSLNVSTEEIIKMTSLGKISFQDVNNAFKSMTSEGGVFFDGMKTASQTLSGQLSTLSGGVQQLSAGLAEVLLPAIKDIVGGLNSAIEGFLDMDGSTKTALVTAGLVAAALPPIITGVGALSKKVKELTISMKAGNAAALANPYVAVGVAIAAVVAGLTAWIVKQNDIIGKTKELKKNTEELAGLFDEVDKAKQRVNESSDSDFSTEIANEVALQKAQAEATKKSLETLKNFLKNQTENDSEKLIERSKQYKILKDQIKNLYEEEKNGIARNDRTPVEIDNNKFKSAKAALDELNKKYKDVLDKYPEFERNSSESKKNLIEALAQMLELGVSEQKIIQESAKNDNDKLLILKQMLEAAKELNAERAKKVDTPPEEKKVEEETTTEAVKTEKDRYDLLAEIHRQYVENKEKIESQLLTQSEKAALQAENAKNEALYKEYEDYLARKENLTEEKEAEINENASLNSFIAYLDKKENLNFGYFEDYKEFLDLQESAEQQFLDDNLENYIEYLQAREAAGKELSEAETSALERLKNLEDADSAMSDTEEKLKKLQTLGGWLDTASRSFVSNLETGNVAAELLGENFSIATDAASQIVGNIRDMADSLVDAESQAKLIGKSIAAGLEAAGEIADNIFSAVVEDLASGLEAAISVIEEELSATLKKLEDGYNDEIAAAEEAKNAKLQILKDEYAQRGIIIETGLESELEKAQTAYQQALDALQEYEDETTSARQAQLEAYKEQLGARNDEDIQQALEAKERELAAVEDKKKAELQKNADTKAAELERQKIIDDAEKKATEIEKQYQYERDLAEYNSEVAKLNREHEMAVEQFNIKKAQDIANIWIAQAAGIATIWATAMQLGPIAGPIAAGILTGTLATVAGVQTGLIAAQSPPATPTMPTPPAKYMTGGVIPGNDNEDRTLLLASSGERVLTQQQNENFERLVNSLENGGNSPVINVHVYVDSEEIGIERQLIEIQKKDRWSGKWGM